MSDDTTPLNYNLNNIHTIRVDKDTSLNIGAFRGQAQLTVWQDRQAIFKLRLDHRTVHKLNETIQLLRKSGPDTRIPMIINEWSQELKCYEAATTIIFGKDDKNIFYIEIKPKHAAPVTIPLKGSRNITIGSEPESDQARSTSELDVLQGVLVHDTRMLRQLSTFAMPKPNYSNGRNPSSGRDRYSNKGAPSSRPSEDVDEPF